MSVFLFIVQRDVISKWILEAHFDAEVLINHLKKKQIC
jgi:hypothetical protein